MQLPQPRDQVVAMWCVEQAAGQCVFSSDPGRCRRVVGLLERAEWIGNPTAVVDVDGVGSGSRRVS